MMLHNFECKVGNFEESSRRISIELIYRENYFIDHNQETISHQRILKGQDHVSNIIGHVGNKSMREA